MGNGVKISCLAYADDITLFATTHEQAQRVLDRVNNAAAKLGLLINVDKTKCLYMGGPPANLQLDQTPIEDVSSFVYLGSKIVNNKFSASDEIDCRIGKAGAAFAQLRECLWSRNEISIHTKMKIYRTIILPILLYGAETWTTLKTDITKLEVFQMTCLRSILNITLAHRAKNSSIRETCCYQPLVEELIHNARTRWFGHICRMPEHRLPKRATFATRLNAWRQSRGAPRKTWISQLWMDFEFLKGSFGAANWERSKDNIIQDLASDRKQWKTLCTTSWSQRCEAGQSDPR